GEEVTGWSPPPRPPRQVFAGRYVRLEPLEAARHAAALHEANAEDVAGAMWDYMPVGPFPDLAAYRAWAAWAEASADPLFFAAFDRERGRHGGSLSLLRIAPEAGSIELGYIAWAPLMQRSRAATEAVWLLMDWAFGAGYRRFEWKCNALNAASRRAALRLGLSFEGVFRQAQLVKGRNRDTAWYAAIDREYPALQAAFTAWLEPGNFDEAGRQRQRLSDRTAGILVARG
ncbi:MAG TPA: GNAT family protein, partial [Paracoccaceae bacterium]|nr:GNAT family protein [Paracoccaceae bacterium]